MDKFGGGDLSREVWESINEAFDTMPIAAVVDGKIFCVHGGIPPPWMASGAGGHISYLDKVSNDISDPEDEEPLVWEYLWNDPLPGLTNYSNVRDGAGVSL
jgi:diadenosine tetraphosphatase ApaH/serine/threonine PP2A family protein phosphatase